MQCTIPPTVHCTMHTAHQMLHTARFTLHAAHCMIHIAYSTLHTAHSTLNTKHCTVKLVTVPQVVDTKTMCSLDRPLHTKPLSVSFVQCYVCSAQCAVYSMQCDVCSVLCVVCNWCPLQSEHMKCSARRCTDAACGTLVQGLVKCRIAFNKVCITVSRTVYRSVWNTV